MATRNNPQRATFKRGIIEVDEAYGHCPRALNFSRFWDTETIEKHKAERPIPIR